MVTNQKYNPNRFLTGLSILKPLRPLQKNNFRSEEIIHNITDKYTYLKNI